MKRIMIPILLALAGCATGPAGGDGLYERLGETEGITRIVDNLLYEIAGDDQVRPLFARTDIDRFREKLIEQLCKVSGGPCRYTGDSMPATHRGMNITSAQFNSLVSDLIRAMEKADISTGAQNALLQRLAPMRDDIMNPDRSAPRD